MNRAPGFSKHLNVKLKQILAISRLEPTFKVHTTTQLKAQKKSSIGADGIFNC